MKLKTLLAFVLVGSLALPAFGVEEVYVHHILTRTKQQADKALDEIVNGGASRESFIKAARTYSLDHPSKYAGGDLGWNSRNKLVSEFSDAAFAAEPGDVIPEPVRTQYGWHVIYLKAKRDLQAEAREKANKGPAPTAPTAPTTPTVTAPKPAPATDTAPPPLANEARGSRSKGAVKPPTGVAANVDTAKVETPDRPVVTPAAVVAPDSYAPAESKLDKNSLSLTLTSPKRVELSSRELIVTAVLENNGSETRKIFNPALLPLGFKVRTGLTGSDAVGSFENLAEPSNFVVDLASRSVTGGSFVISDYFKSLPKNGRLWVGWDDGTFTRNFGDRFRGKAEEVADYSAAMEAFSKAFRVSVKGLASHQPTYARELPLAVFDRVKSGDTYFARITLRGPTGDLWFELFTDKQYSGVQHFATLAEEGFYDGLRFFDIQAGDYVQGGCPKNDGTGGPERVSTISKIPQDVSHEKGVLSLVTRLNPRASARSAGSIFFITRKELKDYDGVHVPIGKIVAGEDLLDSLEKQQTGTIASISIVAESRAPNDVVIAAGGTPAVADAVADLAQPNATATPAASGQPTIVKRPELPRVRIETSRGNMVAELFQDDARNTVNNFVTLVEDGFYNPDQDAGRAPLQFFDKNPDYYVRTGSPDNLDAGGPSHTIRSETTSNTRTHQKGTLTMCLDQNSTGQPIPDTGGSQFLILLDDVAFWNGLYTPFGKVVEGLDVLAQIEKGDTIKSIQVIQKRDGLYKATTTPKK